MTTAPIEISINQHQHQSTTVHRIGSPQSRAGSTKNNMHTAAAPGMKKRTYISVCRLQARASHEAIQKNVQPPYQWRTRAESRGHIYYKKNINGKISGQTRLLKNVDVIYMTSHIHQEQHDGSDGVTSFLNTHR